MSDYTPSWGRGSPDPDETPEAARYGGGLDHDHEAAHATTGSPTDAPDGEIGATGPAAFGRPRCPSVVLHRREGGVEGHRHVGGAAVDVGLCRDADRATLRVTVDEAGVLLDVDRGAAELGLDVFGTREGDTAHLDATLAELTAVDGGWRATITADAHGALWRWAATGCLACRNGGDR
jgi:hypothetical protein